MSKDSCGKVGQGRQLEKKGGSVGSGQCTLSVDTIKKLMLGLTKKRSSRPEEWNGRTGRTSSGQM